MGGDYRARLGRRGERAARRFLWWHGYRVVARNWRCPRGEIDLVAIRDDTLVFVEVKSRSPGSLSVPEDAIRPVKRARLRALARIFRRRYGLVDLRYRFDVLAVTAPRWPRRCRIVHYPEAFS